MATGSEWSVESSDIQSPEQVTGLALGTRRRAFKQIPVPAPLRPKAVGVGNPIFHRLTVAEASSRSLRLSGEPVYSPEQKNAGLTGPRYKLAGESAYVHVYQGGVPGLGKRS